MYVIGCVLAVLLVRSRSLFTAAVQPPLILFLVVPLAYHYLTDSSATMQAIALNDAVPLINRFPLMATATGAVLFIAAIRFGLHRAQSSRARAGSSRAGRGSASRSNAATARRAKKSTTNKQAKPDTVKDKLDRITAKAESLKSQPARTAAPKSAAIPAGRAARADRGRRVDPGMSPGGAPSGPIPSGRTQRQAPPPPQRDPRYGTRSRGPEHPSRPLPNVRYRDRDHYDR